MAGKKLTMPSFTTEEFRADCKWEGCRQKAVICEEIEFGKGRHNLCEYHYVEAHHLRAKRWCEAKGLVTVEQKKEYCRRIVGRLMKPFREREPGQDDEEREAA